MNNCDECKVRKYCDDFFCLGGITCAETRDMIEQIRADAIDEFVRCCKATETHLITNWEKPFGIDFEGIDVIAEQLKGE